MAMLTLEYFYTDYYLILIPIKNVKDYELLHYLID